MGLRAGLFVDATRRRPLLIGTVIHLAFGFERGSFLGNRRSGACASVTAWCRWFGRLCRIGIGTILRRRLSLMPPFQNLSRVTMNVAPGGRRYLYLLKVSERLGHIVQRDHFLFCGYQTACPSQLLVCVAAACQCVANISTPKSLESPANMWMSEDNSRPQPVQTNDTAQKFGTASQPESQSPDGRCSRLRRAGIHVLKVVCHWTVVADERRKFSNVYKSGDVVQVGLVVHGPM